MVVGVISSTRVGLWCGVETVLVWNLRHAVWSERQVYSHCLALGILSRAHKGTSFDMVWLANAPMVVPTRLHQPTSKENSISPTCRHKFGV
jgi:hypothetical protein